MFLAEREQTALEHAGVLMMVLYGALIAYLVNFMENRQKQEENLVLTYFVTDLSTMTVFQLIISCVRKNVLLSGMG